MKQRSAFLPILCLPLLAMLTVFCGAGCRSGGGSRDDASVRLINAATAAQDLSVSVDGQRVWKHAPFRSNTGFQGVGEGTYQVSIDALTNGVRLSGRNYLLCQKGKAYTVVAVNQAGAAGEPPGLRIFNEDRSAPVPPDKVRLRFINVGEANGAVDVLFNNIVGFSGTFFGARTTALLLDPGAYALRMVTAADATPLSDPVSLRFVPGHAYTLVAMGGRAPGASQPLSLVAYPDDQ